ncbi:acetyl-CoA carboxylase biotin carboxyl carrier protein [Aquirufa antheringensis]|jgi:acetyl-CoA carboxylase biotin carboxyl carrier protein|uniref:Biotin carboxyl carrier protein of acetyl-CoA carboxylase n=1 Tax=Aquirufa antheringensis TaxID=2516559 RepID=A0A4Q9BEG8_9BACT|nr:acetyl-CoA carboxylase biotin carboxyl carrier protein [Aquirufa antheringensis]MCZ2484390.1 acetyl-CoA carboxylase biotin carboxyl carrier protein [Aquirufa antheringensis]MCZ2487741.1 acetyl-CoA carboxylase biotin carboxyl carrier protein [Aquirufa antheringensis]MCZ2489434.1 acetyl-CoA carboxylase biotin carboxyl carrier protein [Aquirufa antheringensis]TBH74404.1 acetyl-CoA carboxylase biotin carboxyl carrier protein [Aquirufa antheringensis]USQ03002.1 acetyl-CoA carboxylase biotin carb
MDTKEIQRLLDYIAKSPLAEVSIETEGLKVSVKKHGEAAPVVSVVSAAPAAAPVAAAPAAAAPAAPAAPAPVADNLYTVKSPMIGTFYRAPGPDKDNFVEVGTEIAPGKTVCVIEAMKLFNEIDSEISGKIVKILVENASPVEFDQPLFLVEKA